MFNLYRAARQLLAEVLEREKLTSEAKMEDTAPAFSPTCLNVGRLSLAPEMLIDLQVSDADRQLLLDKTSETWHALGRNDPHWSVLSWEGFHVDVLQESEFYATAAHDLEVLKSYFARSGFSLNNLNNAIELGCGVGRMTQALAKELSGIIGIDISEPHLKIAQEYFDRKGINNVSVRRITSLKDLDKLPNTDLFYSVIVLQHNPPPVIAEILRVLLTKVSRGGFAFFQVPTYRMEYSFSCKDYIPDPLGRMEMHVLPQQIVFEILYSVGFRLLQVEEDAAVGDPLMSSHTFFAQRAER